MDRQNLQLLLLTVFGISGFFLFVFLIAFLELDKLALASKLKQLQEEAGTALSATSKHVPRGGGEEEEEEPKKAATIHFSKANLLHAGHSRETFLGSLGEKLVAIKRFEPAPFSSPLHDPFFNELHIHASTSSMHSHHPLNQLNINTEGLNINVGATLINNPTSMHSHPHPHLHQVNIKNPTSLPSSLLHHHQLFNHPTTLPLSPTSSSYHQFDHPTTLSLSHIASPYHPHHYQLNFDLATQPFSPSSLQGGPNLYQCPSYNVNSHPFHHELNHSTTLPSMTLSFCHPHHEKLNPPTTLPSSTSPLYNPNHHQHDPTSFLFNPHHHHHHETLSPLSFYHIYHQDKKKQSSFSSSSSTPTSTSSYQHPHQQHWPSTHNYQKNHSPTTSFPHDYYHHHQPTHSYLVPLLEYCVEEQERLLVYEYAPNKDLATALAMSDSNWKASHHDNTIIMQNMNSTCSLAQNIMPWIARLKIATQVAEAIAFLHHACQPPIAHRDLKASSILLTKDFDARLGSLNEARTLEDGELPLYDIYCFGKILLHLILGSNLSKVMELDDIDSYIQVAHPLFDLQMSHNSFTQLVDPSMMINEDLAKEVLGVAMLAKSCLDVRNLENISMLTILHFLKDPIQLLNKPF